MENRFKIHPEDKLYFPWNDVMACVNNEASPMVRGMKCPVCGKDVKWIKFCSPAWTWEKLCGREGPLALCLDCHLQLYFFCTCMN